MIDSRSYIDDGRDFIIEIILIYYNNQQYATPTAQ